MVNLLLSKGSTPFNDPLVDEIMKRVERGIENNKEDQEEQKRIEERYKQIKQKKLIEKQNALHLQQEEKEKRIKLREEQKFKKEQQRIEKQRKLTLKQEEKERQIRLKEEEKAKKAQELQFKKEQQIIEKERRIQLRKDREIAEREKRIQRKKEERIKSRENHLYSVYVSIRDRLLKERENYYIKHKIEIDKKDTYEYKRYCLFKEQRKVVYEFYRLKKAQINSGKELDSLELKSALSKVKIPKYTKSKVEKNVILKENKVEKEEKQIPLEIKTEIKEIKEDKKEKEDIDSELEIEEARINKLLIELQPTQGEERLRQNYIKEKNQLKWEREQYYIKHEKQISTENTKERQNYFELKKKKKALFDKYEILKHKAWHINNRIKAISDKLVHDIEKNEQRRCSKKHKELSRIYIKENFLMLRSQIIYYETNKEDINKKNTKEYKEYCILVEGRKQLFENYRNKSRSISQKMQKRYEQKRLRQE